MTSTVLDPKIVTGLADANNAAPLVTQNLANVGATPAELAHQIPGAPADVSTLAEVGQTQWKQAMFDPPALYTSLSAWQYVCHVTGQISHGALPGIRGALTATWQGEAGIAAQTAIDRFENTINGILAQVSGILGIFESLIHCYLTETNDLLSQFGNIHAVLATICIDGNTSAPKPVRGLTLQHLDGFRQQVSGKVTTAVGNIELGVTRLLGSIHVSMSPVDQIQTPALVPFAFPRLPFSPPTESDIWRVG